MNVVVIGAGGVGGYFGAKLARAGASVTLVARGAHLEKIHANGITIHSAVDGKWCAIVRAVETLDDTPPADVVLICVKSFDTETAADLARPVIGPDTAVLSLQNGIDNEDKLAAVLGGGHVMGGIAYVFSNITAPGVIAHHQYGRIVFGELGVASSLRAEAMLALFHNATIPAELSSDIRKALWDKYIFQTALGGVTALTRLPTHYVQSKPEIRDLWRRQVEELLALAQAEGIIFDPDKMMQFSAFLDSLAPGNYSSLYQDLIRGNRLELEAFHGHALRLSARHNIPTATLAAVYAGLVGHRDGAQSAAQ